MEWYNQMADGQKKDFKKVIAVCTAGTILVLLVPMVFRWIFS